MSQSPETSPAETVAATWRTVVFGLMMAVGLWAIDRALVPLVCQRVSQIKQRIERMILRFQAGKLWRMQPRAAAVQAKRASRAKPAFRLPRDYGWLLKAGTHRAAFYTLQLQTLLSTPEMAAMLETSAQARRVLRPLCRALAVDVPWAVRRPRAERPRKPRTPRPKPEPFQRPLPRGVLTWARRDKALEAAIKARDALVLQRRASRRR